VKINHEFVTTVPDEPTPDVIQPSAWNAPLKVSEGLRGDLLVRDDNMPDGLNGVESSGNVGWVLTDQGFGELPEYGPPSTPSFLDQQANVVLAGPTNGPATQPSFRVLTITDLPNNVALIGDLASYVPTNRKVNGHALTSDVVVTKADIGLGVVENTALSTWPGSASITTLGTITAGTWTASAIAAQYLGAGPLTNGFVLTLVGGVSTWAAAATGGSPLPTAPLGQVLISQGAGVAPIFSAALNVSSIAIADALFNQFSLALPQGRVSASSIRPVPQSVAGPDDTPGDLFNFTNSTVSAPGGIVTGGGSFSVLARWDGTNYVVIGGVAGAGGGGPVSAGALTGTTLAANVVTSSLTTVGTIIAGTWNGDALGPAYLGAGTPTNGFVLTIASGVPTWQAAAGGSGSLAVGTSAITGGAAGSVLYHAAGNVLGEMTTTGTGTTLALSDSPSFTTKVAAPLYTGTTGTLNITASIPIQGTVTLQGNALVMSSSNAVPGTVSGNANGGNTTVTTGNGARFSSGDANGGFLLLTTGSGLGQGFSGSASLKSLSDIASGTVAVGTGDGSSSAGSTGNLSLFTGNCTAQNAAGPVGNVLVTTGSASVTRTSANPTLNAGIFNVTTGAGQSTSNTAGIASSGGAIQLFTGPGGAATAVTGVHTGGPSGNFVVATGAGGNAAAGGTPTGGDSGFVQISTGLAGTGTTPGNVGVISFRPGTVTMLTLSATQASYSMPTLAGAAANASIPITVTWNTTGVVDGALRIQVTETAKGANSLYLAIYGGVAGATIEHSIATGGVNYNLGKVRTDDRFNVAGTDGVTAGPFTTITGITVKGGIVTAISGT
jgi:hypothetical protein